MFLYKKTIPNKKITNGVSLNHYGVILVWGYWPAVEITNDTITYNRRADSRYFGTVKIASKNRKYIIEPDNLIISKNNCELRIKNNKMSYYSFAIFPLDFKGTRKIGPYTIEVFKGIGPA